MDAEDIVHYLVAPRLCARYDVCALSTEKGDRIMSSVGSVMIVMEVIGGATSMPWILFGEF